MSSDETGVPLGYARDIFDLTGGRRPPRGATG